jgi:hypothetical protein
MLTGMVVAGSRLVIGKISRWALVLLCVGALPAFAVAARQDHGGLAGEGRLLGARATTGWQALKLPLPAGAKSNGAGFAGPVACAATGHCVILGEYTTSTGLNEDAIETESAGVWTTAKSPLPTGGSQAANLGPYGLACPGIGDCVGTSLYVGATSVEADILKEVEGSWSALTMPMPANTSRSSWPQITSVVCGATGACVIVGSYTTTAGLHEGLIVTEEKGGFVASEAPTPGGVTSNQGAWLTGVGCFQPTSCVAAGYYESAAGAREGLLVADYAGVEAARSAPLPANAASNPLVTMEAVSCGATTGCEVVGGYESSTGDRFGVIDGSANGRWTTIQMPSPGSSSASPSPVMFAMSCVGAGSCLAVGQYTDSSGKTEALGLVEQSGRWSATILPGTQGSGALVTVVSCSTSTSCVTAGRYETRYGQLGYLGVLSGSTWSYTSAPVPPKANANPFEDLGSIACPAAGACAASGTYSESGNVQVELPVVVWQ